MSEGEHPGLIQYAPFPTILEALVKEARLGMDGSWTVHLVDMTRDEDHGRGQAGGLTLDITTRGYDTYHPDRGELYRVHHFFPVPAATYNEASWLRWLFERYCDVWRHEAMESFAIGDERPFAPNHGPGCDPYTVVQYATDEDRRMSFRGVLNP